MPSGPRRASRATRNPVSSKCATPAPARAAVMAAVAGEMSPAILRAARPRARGRGAAEHLAQRGAGPVPRQELAVPQIGAQRRGPRPVLYRRGHPVRRVRPGALPAARAFPLDHLVLGDLRLDRRDLGHLPPLHACLPGARQPGAARAAGRRLVTEHVVRSTGQLHGRARLALRPARLAAGLLPQRLRRGLAQPV